MLVRERGPEHAAAGAGDALFFRGEGAGELDAGGAGMGPGLDGGGGDHAEAAQRDGVHIQRVGADVKADGLSLGGEAVGLRPVRAGREAEFFRLGDAAEQSGLA